LNGDDAPNFRKRKTRTQTQQGLLIVCTSLSSSPEEKVQKVATTTTNSDTERTAIRTPRCASRRCHRLSLPSPHTATSDPLRSNVTLFNTPCPWPFLESSPHGHCPVVPLQHNKSGESLVILPTIPIRYVHHGRLAEQSDPTEPGTRATNQWTHFF
jgi:hypothetical protein